MNPHLPPGVGPDAPAPPPALTGTRCYLCDVALTNEFGFKAGLTARWHSYNAASRECCRKCAEELDNAVIKAERAAWPSPEFPRIKYWLLDRSWRQVDWDPAKKHDFYAHCGKWALQWRAGSWVLCFAEDYEFLVEKSSGETLEELREELARWEVEA